MLSRVLGITLVLLTTVAWAEPTAITNSQVASMTVKEGDIVAYYDKDWRLTKDKVARGFYRKLLKIENKGFLVQDFYVNSNTKQTDAFWITHKEELTAAIVNHQDIALMIWYPDGNKEEQYTYKDGALQHSVGWHRNGQKRYEGNFKNDKRQGEWTGWFNNGQQHWQGSFVEGSKEGKWSVWYPSGQLRIQGNYKNNQKQDMWIYWDRRGRKAKEEQYKNNEKIAQWISFDEGK